MTDSCNRQRRMVHCERCAFEYAVSTQSSQAACPACGLESPVNHCLFSPCSENLMTGDGASLNLCQGTLGQQESSGQGHCEQECCGRERCGHKELFRIDTPQNDWLKCRMQNCPRLRNASTRQKSPDKIPDDGVPVAEKTDSPLHQLRTTPMTARKTHTGGSRRRRAVLVFTVILQISVLLVAGVFMARAFHSKNRMQKAPVYLARKPAAPESVKTPDSLKSALPAKSAEKVEKREQNRE